jgi:hypothetical protein
LLSNRNACRTGKKTLAPDGAAITFRSGGL